MFQNLRQGQPFYILYKGENPRYEAGNVLSVSNPMPKFPNNFQLPQQQEMVVDVKVRVGESTLDYQKLPAHLSIADFTPLGNNVVVSDNKDAINAEIEAMQQISRDALAKTDYHNSVITACDEMLKQLNPQFAKDKERDEEIFQLKEQINSLTGNVSELVAMMKQNLSSTKETVSKTPKNN